MEHVLKSFVDIQTHNSSESEMSRKYDKNAAMQELNLINSIRLLASQANSRSIQELANKLGVTTSTLYTLWKTRTGKSWNSLGIEVIIRDSGRAFIKQKKHPKKSKK